MQLKRFAILTSSLALLALTLSPLMVNAQTSDLPAGPPPGAERHGGRGPFEQLNLTEAQQQELAEIREQAHSQIEAVLTDEQRQQAQALREQFMARREAGEARPSRPMGRGPGEVGPFAELNLTEEQQQEIREIMIEAREQSEAVLTDAQRQQLQQMQQNWREQRPGYSGGGR